MSRTVGEPPIEPLGRGKQSRHVARLRRRRRQRQGFQHHEPGACIFRARRGSVADRYMFAAVCCGRVYHPVVAVRKPNWSNNVDCGAGCGEDSGELEFPSASVAFT